MRRWILALVIAFTAVVAVEGAPSPPPAAAPFDMRSVAPEMVSIFNPKFITNQGSELNTACERLLLVCQALSVLAIVGGFLFKLRKDQEHMESVASMMLKVAFIASIPFWRGVVLDTSASIADAIGYQVIDYNHPTDTSNLMGRMLDMASQWTPPGSAQTDTAAGMEAPQQGDEGSWAAKAWNWAKGVATAASNMLDSMWQAVTGAVRSVIIFIFCVVVLIVWLLMVVLMYFGELLRYLLFWIGCAILPVFIGGLQVELLKNQSVKYIIGLGSIALWNVAWAIGNIVTTVMIWGVSTWMAKMATTAAAAAGLGMVAPPIAAAAPYLAWGVLILAAVLTIMIVLWSLVCLVFAPVALTKMLTSGAQMIGGMVGTASAGVMAAGGVAAGVAATAVTGGAAAPAAAAFAKGGAMAGKAATGAAGVFARAAHGAASLAGRVGGARVGSAATNLASRMSASVGSMVGGIGDVASGSAHAMSDSLSGRGGEILAGSLRTASRVLSMGARINPQREHDAGAHLGTGVAGLFTPTQSQPAGGRPQSQRASAPWLARPNRNRP